MSSGTLVLGVVNGLIIGLLAVGFVLVYKANRFLNLAHAQLGAISAMLLAKVVNDWHWGFWPSFVACIAVGAGTGLVVEKFVVAVVRRRSRAQVRLVILTIGVSDVLLALTYIPGLTPTSQAPYPEPFTSHLEIGGVVLSGMAVLTIIAVPALLVILTVFLELTSLGKQVRAAASNPDAARLSGISVDRMSLMIWGVAGGLSALSAIMNGPTIANYNVEAAGPYLLMLCLGAAAVGAFVSIPAAVGGGLALGLLYQIVSAETMNAGTAELAVFGAILLIIAVRGRAIARSISAEGAAVPDLRGVRRRRGLPRWSSVLWAPRVGLAAVLAVAVVVPLLPYFSEPGNQFLLVLVLIYAVIGVSLTVLVGWGGQISMGSIAIVGIGAYLTARWAGHAGWNLVDLIVVTGLAGAVVSIVIGLPALRFRGVTLAVVTLGLAVIAPDWVFQQQWLVGPTPSSTIVAPTSVLGGLLPLGSSLEIYYVALVVLVAMVVAGRVVRRSAGGRAIIAVRDNERASSAFGLRPATVKLRVFALSGFVAASAGVFWAITWQSLSPAQFPADASIAVLALPVVGGLGSLGGTVAAAVVLYMGTFFVGPHVSGLLGSLGQNEGFLLFIAGIGVVGAMVGYPNGIAGWVQERWQAVVDRRLGAPALAVAGAPTAAPATVPGGVAPPQPLPALRRRPDPVQSPAPPNAAPARRSPAPDGPPLVVEDVRLRIGGLSVLGGASLEVQRGEIVGLIGANGAGKTTLMNVVSGVVRPQGGSVRVFGQEVVGRPPETRARLGVARSFQEATLFPGLTVVETIQVALGRTARGLRRSPAADGAGIGRAERASRRRAMEIIEAFGFEAWADSLTVELSTGMRRICDLMAQVAAGPRLLLLDEPTAGVAQRESESFGELIGQVRQRLGCAVLLIEHDMPLLMGLCDRIYALEAGVVIAEGSPDQVRNDPAVIASYLGTDRRAAQRSDDRPAVSPVGGAPGQGGMA